MFDIGWPEMLLVAVVLIVVVGPKDLPGMLRTFGRTTSKLRSMAGDFRKQFDDALKEAELDDVKSIAGEARKFDPRAEIRKHLSPMEKAGKDVKAGVDNAMKPQQPAKGGEPAASQAKPAEPLKAGASESPAGKSAANGAAKPGPKAAKAESKPAGKKPAAKSSAANKPAAQSAAAKPGPAKPDSSKPNTAGKPKAAASKTTSRTAKARASKSASAGTKKAGPAS